MKKIFGLLFLFSVFALSPLWAFDDMRGLSHQIDVLASDVHRQAQEAIHRYSGWQEQAALRDLYALARQAHHFHEQVESWYQDSRHTYQDYANLVRSYDQARRSFYELPLFVHIRYDFDQLGLLIQSLWTYYNEGGSGDIRTLAHYIDMTAERIHLWAEESSRGWRTQPEEQALRDLRTLATQARRYHELIEFWYQDPSFTYQDYANLSESYDQTRRTFGWLRPVPWVQSEFNRLAMLINQLNQYYAHYVPIPPRNPLPPVPPVPPLPPRRPMPPVPPVPPLPPRPPFPPVPPVPPVPPHW